MGKRLRIMSVAAAGLGLVLIGLVFGTGAASAGPCNDEAFGEDVWVRALDAGDAGVFVGVHSDVFENGSDFSGVIVCWGAPDDVEPHQLLSVTAGDPPHAGPGVAVSARRCDSSESSCPYLLAWTGANADGPSVTTDSPGDGAAGGAVSIGPATCYAVNSPTETCLGPMTVAGAAVAENDTPAVNSSSACVNVDGDCKATVVNGVAVETGANPDGTVSVTTLGDELTLADVPANCIEFNAEC